MFDLPLAVLLAEAHDPWLPSWKWKFPPRVLWMLSLQLDPAGGQKH